jgi:hypothetical protein
MYTRKFLIATETFDVFSITHTERTRLMNESGAYSSYNEVGPARLKKWDKIWTKVKIWPKYRDLIL